MRSIVEEYVETGGETTNVEQTGLIFVKLHIYKKLEDLLTITIQS